MRAGSEHFKAEPGDKHIKRESVSEVTVNETPVIENTNGEIQIGENINSEGSKAELSGFKRHVIPDFVTYPREFITYKWYKPIITIILFAIIYLLMEIALIIAVIVANGGDISGVLDMVDGGYDTMDVYTATGVILELGGVACMIPALALANKISGGRTFKSYESSRGGWNYGIFFKCLLIAIVVVAIPVVIDEVFFSGARGASRFTTEGLILLTILGPMQCIAEEYAFRSLLMQTVGSWFKFTPLAIVISAAVFASMHPYNMIGVADIFISGLLFCTVAWLGRGIESSSALHIANNMAIFYCVGFGYGEISSQVAMSDIFFTAATYGVYTIIMIVLRKKGVFDKQEKNDAAAWNARAEKKRARKAAKNSSGDVEFIK